MQAAKDSSAREARGRRILRWLRAGLILVIALLAARVLLPSASMALIDRALRSRGLTCSYETLDLGLLRGQVDLWHLGVRPLAAPKGAQVGDLLRVEHAAIDLSMRDLLRGEISLRRIGVEGVDVRLDLSDAGIAALRGFAASPESDAAPAAPPEDEAQDAEVDLGLPFELTLLRLEHARVHLRDDTSTPPLDVLLDANLLITNLGARDVPARLEFTLTSPSLVDVLRLRAEGSSLGRDLDAQLRVELAAFRPAALASHLRRVGVLPLAQQVSFDASAQVRARPHAADPRAVQWSARLHDLRGLEDLRESIALDQLDLQLQTRAGGEIDVQQVELEGLRVLAGRSAQGRVRCGGFELEPLPAAPNAAPSVAAQVPAPVSPTFWIAAARASGISLRFDDAAVDPPASLALQLESATLDQLGNDPLRANEPASFAAVVHLPGVVERIAVEGNANVFGPERKLALALAASGIEPTVLEGYLRPLGWSADLRAGVAGLKLDAATRDEGDGVWRGRAELSQLNFADRGGAQGGERALLSLASLAVESFEFDPARALRRVGEVRVVGFDAAAALDDAGQLHLLGLKRIAASTATPHSAAPAPAPAVPMVPPALPRIELDRLIGQDARFTFRDSSRGEEHSIVARAPRFALTDFGMGGDASDEPATAQLSAQASVDGLAGLLDLNGTLSTSPEPFSVGLQLALRGEGIDLRPLAPYTQSLGLRPTLADGELVMELSARARNLGDAWQLESSLSNVQLREADATLASLQRLAIEGARIEARGAAVEAIAIEAPTLAISRDAQGGLHALGMRFEARSTPVAPTTSAPAHTAEGAPAASNFALGSLRIQGARLGWSDALLLPPLETSLQGEVELGPLFLGAAAQPLAFRVALGSPGNFERASLEGMLALPPGDLSLEARLQAVGLSGGTLARYLPENLSPNLRAGSVAGRISAALGPASEGGDRVRCVLSGVEVREAGEQRPRLELGALSMAAARLDPAAGVYMIDELSLTGFAADVRRDVDGSILLPGLTITPASAARDAAGAISHQAAQSAQAVPPESARSARAGEPPLVRIGKLDLGMSRLSISPIDPSGGEALEFAARLWSSHPLVLCDRELEKVPPLELSFDAALQPLLDELHADLRLEAFAREPRLEVDLALRGIDASALTRVMPELSARLDANSMKNGALSARLSASLRLDRRDPAQFDFRRDFGAELALEDLRLRADPASEPVAGLDALRIDVRRFSPASGELHIKEIEIERPSAQLIKRADGIHAFGLLIKLPATPTEAEVSSQPASQPANEVAAQAPAGPELRIDDLLVREIDLLVRDESVDPVLVFPIDQLHAQLQRFTTRAFQEPVPLRFLVSLGSSASSMPARNGEQLAAFDEVSVAGQLSLSPLPKGWVKVDLSAMDLRNFAGPAAQQGVELGDGYLDAGIRVRLPGDGSASVNAGFTFSELSLSEPADGPISSLLHLPAPLDMVLFALENADEEHAVPLNFRLDQGGVSTGELVGAAVESVGVVIATAIASAPLRVMGSVTDLFGITGGDEDPLADLAVTLEYAPGAIDLDAAQKASLAKAIGALADDEVVLVAQHALGAADIAFAERLANPDPQACRELVARTRLRKTQLQRTRDELAADARVLYAVGREDEAQLASERMRAVARELASTEDALDGVLELLRPNAERHRARRTRLASLELAQARLDALREFIAGTTLERAGERTELRKPTFALPAPDAPTGSSRILLMPRLRKTSD